MGMDVINYVYINVRYKRIMNERRTNNKRCGEIKETHYGDYIMRCRRQTIEKRDVVERLSTGVEATETTSGALQRAGRRADHPFSIVSHCNNDMKFIQELS